MDERGLRLLTSVLDGHSDIMQGYNQHGHSWHLIGQQHVPNLSEVFLHVVLLNEHQAHIPPEISNQFLLSWVAFQMHLDGLAHHGVHAHQNHTLSLQGHVDLLHLLGTYIICSHNEAFRVII